MANKPTPRDLLVAKTISEMVFIFTTMKTVLEEVKESEEQSPDFIKGSQDMYLSLIRLFAPLILKLAQSEREYARKMMEAEAMEGVEASDAAVEGPNADFTQAMALLKKFKG